MKALKLRTPVITFERARISLFLIIYMLLAEYVDPRPFFNTTLAKVLYGALVVEIIRQFITFSMEVRIGAVVRARTWAERWERARKGVPEFARYRVRRVLTILAGLWAAGFMIDALTTRCEGAMQCVLLAPRMAVENLPQALQIALYIAIGMMQLIIMMWSLTKVGFVKVQMPGTIDVAWDDIYGQDQAKAKVRQQVELLEASSEVEQAGGYMPKGLLLYGPPGTGKTYLAKAAASASTKPLILVPPGGFASTFVGVNFLKVFSLFRLIRKLGTRHGGVIVFIDEIDSLGTRGHEVAEAHQIDKTAPLACTDPFGATRPATYIDGGGGNQGTLQAFLSAMDGMEEPRGLINKLLRLLGLKPLPPPPVKWLIIGATNRKQALDPALLRAGRLGRQVHVPHPGKGGRVKTYQGYLAKIKHVITPEQIEWLATQHYRGTGAEIKDVVNEAVLLTFDREENKGIVTTADLIKAMTRVKFGEPEEPFETQAGLHMVSIHEAGHAVVIHHLLKHRQKIWFATVERFGGTGGMVAHTPITDDWVESRTDVEADVCVSLASRIVEILILGEQTNGHGGDGPAATEKAAQMVRSGHTYVPGTKKGRLGTLDDDEEFNELVERVLRHAYMRTWALLKDRLHQVEAVARMLEERGTVPGDEIHETIERMERE